MTKVELQLILDADIYLFFEKGMRGEGSYISYRYNKVSNKYLKTYFQKQESKHFIQLNANYLYRYAILK